MFRIRLVEQPMPTGSKDPDVLLAWLLDSMGLVDLELKEQRLMKSKVQFIEW